MSPPSLWRAFVRGRMTRPFTAHRKNIPTTMGPTGTTLPNPSWLTAISTHIQTRIRVLSRAGGTMTAHVYPGIPAGHKTARRPRQS